LALLSFFIGAIGAVPCIALSLLAIAIIILKYFSLLVKVAGMKLTDGATSPNTTPFSYFGALFALIALLLKATAELID